MSVPLEDYALIGDCETAALVSRHGSVDWLCWPDFDSDACFAALLGTPEHGCWSIAPAGEVKWVTHRYRGPTLILETDFRTADGSARLVDFMPIRGTATHLARLVVGLEGRLQMRLHLAMRFGYGQIKPWLEPCPGGMQAIAGPDRVMLRSPAHLQLGDAAVTASFQIGAGDTVPFTLSRGPAHASPPDAIDPQRALAETESWWQEWTGRFRGKTDWPEAVLRSLITLESPHLALDRGRGGGANGRPARTDRRRSELGLPVLLVARHRFHARGFAELRFP